MSKGEEGFCPFAYQGQIIDKETGLYYNRFRYYSPEEGLYISQDPIKLSGGIQFYSYVHDPNGWIDPLGLANEDGKPKYSPSEDKWIAKGGSIDKSGGNGNWKYTDWEGNSVSYKNGYPDFKNGTDKNGNKNFVKQEVTIKDLEFNHGSDFTKANNEAIKQGGTAKGNNSTWHHHEDMETMQEVDKKIHRRFTHEGGCAASKK